MMRCTIASTTQRGVTCTRPSCGSQHAHERRPRPLAPPGERGRQQHQPSDPLGMAQAELERDAPAHAVADHVRALDAERVHQLDDRAREERRVIARAERLVRVAEARAGRARSCGTSRRAPRPSAGTSPWSRRARGSAAPARRRRRSGWTTRPTAVATRWKRSRSGPVIAAGRGEEADAEVEVVADHQPRPCDRPPCRRAGRRRCRSQVSRSAVSVASGVRLGRRRRARRRPRRRARPRPRPRARRGESAPAGRRVERARIEAVDEDAKEVGYREHRW